MELLSILNVSFAALVFFSLWRLLFSLWISPNRFCQKLRSNGFVGPSPNFPLGNIGDMKKQSCSSGYLTHDIHSSLFPYFSRWQKLYGNVFIYWLGIEPFLYIADPEFLKQMSANVMAKSWGKPRVFKEDRDPMFGNGLVMTEGDLWVRHRNVISPAFSPPNLKAMLSLMVETASKMVDKWTTLTNNGKQEIDVEADVLGTAAEIIAKTSFGITDENGIKVFQRMRELQVVLFKSNHYVGVPLGKFMCPKQTLKAKRLGREIDSLLLSVINARKKAMAMSGEEHSEKDLLGLLLAEGNNDNKQALKTTELVDECKSFFFAGHESTAMAITWSLLLLAIYSEWQDQLREEIREVVGDKELDFTIISGLKKMGWVINETMRLYPSAPNAQRQAREDIQVEDVVVPKGTNMWIDLVAIHHDPTLWGDDVHLFKPERFKDDLYGGCKHKMGYVPFGFGGRMCIGRNLTMMEYKVVLTLILSSFSISVSPSYCHSPTILLSLRPAYGMPLIFQRLTVN